MVKLKTWLRMPGIPYGTRTDTNRDTPYKELPVAGIDGELVPAPPFIQRLLQLHPQAVADHLSETERAQACALAALCERHLYFVTVCIRYCIPSNYNAYKPLPLD